MERGDIKVIIAIIIVLMLITIMVMNIDNIFPTPTAQEAVKQMINKT